MCIFVQHEEDRSFWLCCFQRVSIWCYDQTRHANGNVLSCDVFLSGGSVLEAYCVQLSYEGMEDIGCKSSRTWGCIHHCEFFFLSF